MRPMKKNEMRTGAKALVESLEKAGVEHELKLYEKGIHALSLATEVTAVPGRAEYLSEDVAGWVDLCAAWLKRVLG